jgi:hypothetical protein
VTEVFSFDAPSLSVLTRGNRAATGSASMTVHGSRFGHHVYTQAGRVEDTACEATDWFADATVYGNVKVSSGVRGTQRVVIAPGGKEEGGGRDEERDSEEVKKEDWEKKEEWEENKRGRGIWRKGRNGGRKGRRRRRTRFFARLLGAASGVTSRLAPGCRLARSALCSFSVLCSFASGVTSRLVGLAALLVRAARLVQLPALHPIFRARLSREA